MKVYVDNGGVVIAGQDLTMRIEDADLKMSKFEQYERDQHNITPIRMMPTHVFSTKDYGYRVPDLIIPHINYEVGKEYTVEQLFTQSPPNGTVIINESDHVLQYKFDHWHVGTRQVDLEHAYPSKLVKFKVIHIP